MSSKIQIKPQKRGRPALHYTYNQINHAIKSTHSMKMASEYLNVSYTTFQKWAKQYDLWAPLKTNKGIRQRNSTKISPFDLQKILRGENPSPFRETVLLKKCFKEGYLEQTCSTCGSDHTHITDNTYPLLLDFLDKNHLNTKLENLRVLCLNCVYTLQTTVKGWYRHRDIPLMEVVDNRLERDMSYLLDSSPDTTPPVTEPTSSNTLTTRSSDTLAELDDTLSDLSKPLLDKDIEFIPFEEFQKTLEN